MAGAVPRARGAAWALPQCVLCHAWAACAGLGSRVALLARLWVKTHVNDAKPGTLVVPVADHKRIKTYTFAIKGKAKVETPGGTFEAIQFERIDDPKTTLRFWLAPEKTTCR